MNSFEQVAWADKLVIDETVPWEIKNLCNLMNAIFYETVRDQVLKLQKAKCYTCEIIIQAKKDMTV